MRRTLCTWMLASTFGTGACSFQANGVAGDGAPDVDGNRDGPWSMVGRATAGLAAV